jgi:pantetheine-phosphate adenylyltransferase
MPLLEALGKRGFAYLKAERSHRPLIGVYPGTFDPVTNGHLDIAMRAAQVLDELVVGVFATPSKNLLFTTEERVQLWRESVAEQGLTNVQVESYHELSVDFARRVRGKVIIKGLRSVMDFEAEFQQALMNRNQAPEIETLLMVTEQRYLFLSSSLLKEVAKLGGNPHELVPAPVAQALQRKFAQ